MFLREGPLPTGVSQPCFPLALRVAKMFLREGPLPTVGSLLCFPLALCVAKMFLREGLLANFWVAQPFSLRTFSRVIGKHFIAQCDSHSMIVLRAIGKFLVAQLFPLRTFSRVVDKRRNPHSTIVFEVCWQVFGCTALSSSYVFSSRR
ncbi:hypothetical protein PanWU01x14_012110 [Parasponia andersonii]|uniref:Uncharacterized protein n=1 Tax=Parasponia andersonii TaxID=3476 RepID=A0A2P5E1Q5_PARAD|nr:hypothetical protein PanWU01x14_012110 [Parasponia andersonii]